MFHDVRVPINIEKGTTFGPEFATDIAEAVSGSEQRARRWNKARWRGDISYPLRQVADVADQTNYIRQVVALFLLAGGQLDCFRCRDWNDYQCTDAAPGTMRSTVDDTIVAGDGTTKVFQFTKTYDPVLLMTGSAGSSTYVRDIFLHVGTPAIKVAGVVTAPSSIVNGWATFASAPALGAPLTWTGEFDFVCRFDVDRLPIQMETGRHAQIGSINIRELIDRDELS